MTTPRAFTLLVAAIALTGCDVLIPTYDSTDPTPISNAVVTYDTHAPGDQYTFTGDPGTVTAVPLDGSSGSNLREAFWAADSPVVTDGQSCATWTAEQGDLTQQGAALDIVTADGVTKAVTVTKNVIFGVPWIFNMHVWDSSRTDGDNGSGSILFAQFNLASVFQAPDGTALPLPWHLCARVLRGTVKFKAWPDVEAEPSWYDSTHGGSAPLPDGWGQPGMTGWYIGHLAPGASAAYTGLTTWKIEQDTTTTTTTTPDTTTPDTTTTTTQPVGG